MKEVDVTAITCDPLSAQQAAREILALVGDLREEYKGDEKVSALLDEVEQWALECERLARDSSLIKVEIRLEISQAFSRLLRQLWDFFTGQCG